MNGVALTLLAICLIYCVTDDVFKVSKAAMFSRPDIQQDSDLGS